MRKLFTVVLFLCTSCLAMKAQNAYSASWLTQLLSSLKKANTDPERLNLLIKIGSCYLYKPGEVKSDLDSADFFLAEAKGLNAKLKLPEIQNKVSYLKAEVVFERGDLPKARTAYLAAIDSYMRSGDKEGAANAWISIAVRTMYSSDSTAVRGMHSFEHALNLFKELDDKEREAGVLKYIGDWLLERGDLNGAESAGLKSLSLYKSIGYKKLHYVYDQLALINITRGDFNKALYYSLETIKCVQSTGDTARAFGLYLRMSAVYSSLNDKEKSQYWSKRALINGAKDPELYYEISHRLISPMIKDGKKKEALEFLLKLIKKKPPIADWEKQTIATQLGECYDALGEDELAEKYYQQAIQLAEKTLMKYDDLMAYKQLGDFYLSRKRYTPTSIYFHKVLAFPRGVGDVEMIRSTYLGLFKTDSATGNFLSAIKNYQRYKSLTDSIFTVAKAKQITQLQLQFEKDQKVQQLEDRGKLQQAELEHAGTFKNVTIGGIVLSLLIAGLLYRQSRLRKKSNELLARLLTEKEWLLKEVHHRVKNNLHTVICLLESQAAYLENDALKAVENSQHRIYAMSLIHQKLYQSEDIKMIDMDLYIKEFVQYLADSFGPPANVSIRSVIEPLKLGVSQAIPLGLILNEAVTNAFKYAFPDNKPGEIFISLKLADNRIELVIADNGIGFQRQVDENEPHSLGIELMKGLTRDLKGSITFNNGVGTGITVAFAVDSLDSSDITGINSKHPFFSA
jgi:two-component system, sensor histidine kinase PdtaS